MALIGGRSNIFEPFSLDIFDPFEGFVAVANAPSSASKTMAIANPNIHWKENSDAQVIKVNLPAEGEKVKVDMEDRWCSRSVEEKTHRWHYVERSSAKFVHRFRLPENVRMGQVNATMDNDVRAYRDPNPKQNPPCHHIIIVS
ncbi:hypothetical protein RJ640_017525 [Escallonia rubra]|uniref:SHSP domain-containing protein n=1 Tax=Escallonia rubra TaxID=112253 RepID=A0AA88UEF0_9ASTE|nr:hypothetical protein RJ640_017525 [Escallonia rubra]